MESFYFIAAITGISAIFAVAAIFLGRLGKRWPKYLPAILAAAVAIACMIKAYRFSEGFEALGYFALMLIALIVFIVAMLTAVIMEIVRAKKLRSGPRPGENGKES